MIVRSFESRCWHRTRERRPVDNDDMDSRALGRYQARGTPHQAARPSSSGQSWSTTCQTGRGGVSSSTSPGAYGAPLFQPQPPECVNVLINGLPGCGYIVA